MGYTQPQADRLEELGGRILLNTTAERLVARPLEDGRQEVLGVVVTDNKSGETSYIKAAKAVLLGAGGFDYNDDMKAQYLDIPSPCTFQVETCDGKGIRMAQGVGADLAMMCYGWGNCAYKAIGEEAYANRVVDANIAPLCYQRDTSSMWINRYGRRFCDEAASYDSFWYGFGNGRETTGEMLYTNIPAWYVCDQGNRNRNAGGDGVATPEKGGNLWGVGAADEVPEWVIQADTLEELAEKIGVPAENLIATVDAYNQSVEEGGTDEFGRSYDDSRDTYKLAVNKIEGDHFYAVPLHALCVMTLGGITTNEQMQVLDESGNAIPGLYAAGVVCEWNCAAGATVLSAMTLGRIAGRSAAAEASAA